MPTITAAVTDGPQSPFRSMTAHLDDPRAGEVLIAVAAVGLCATDLHARDGDLPMPLPAVLGHEGAGHVAGVGAGVSTVAVGDPVVIGWPWCGVCRNCQAGAPRYCTQFLTLAMSGARPDGSTPLSEDGRPVHGQFFGQSSFASYALAAERSLVKVDPDAPLHLLGPLGCGIATGAGAVLNTLAPPAGSSLVVFGPGAVGLAAVMAARVAGCAQIIAIARNPRQLDQARTLGATHTVDSKNTDPVAAILELTGGGADFTVEATGNMTVARQAVEALRPLGVCALVGASPVGTELTLDHASLILGRRVVGVNGGDGQSATFIPRLIELYRQGRFPYDTLITTYPFERINDAVTDLANHKTVKAVLQMPATTS